MTLESVIQGAVTLLSSFGFIQPLLSLFVMALASYLMKKVNKKAK